MIRIQIETKSSAFYVRSIDEDNGNPNIGPELARILRNIAFEVEGVALFGKYSLPINDINGKRCGMVVIE